MNKALFFVFIYYFLCIKKKKKTNIITILILNFLFHFQLYNQITSSNNDTSNENLPSPQNTGRVILAGKQEPDSEWVRF